MPGCPTSDCVVPPSVGVSNALGFSGAGVAKCCAMSCPALPLHNVTVCIRVNSCTTVKIQQGCLRDASKGDCAAVYSWGQTYDSWGRKCRVATWQRKVPNDAFIRIRFCPKDSCETSCICDDNGDGLHNPNQLLKFDIDGQDARRVIEAVNAYPGDLADASTGGTYSCMRAACIDPAGGATGDCCYVSPTGEVNWTVDDIAVGAEIVVGPMNDVFFSVPPM